jgi:hypothetical protein
MLSDTQSVTVVLSNVTRGTSRDVAARVEDLVRVDRAEQCVLRIHNRELPRKLERLKVRERDGHVRACTRRSVQRVCDHWLRNFAGRRPRRERRARRRVCPRARPHRKHVEQARSRGS